MIWFPAQSKVKVGCCGWPVSRESYFKQFGLIEIDSTFFNLPRLATALKWSQEAPRDFEFSMKAWQLVTHPAASFTYQRLRTKMGDKFLARCGHFRPTPEVDEAWERTVAVARAVGAKLILFQTPHSFYPSADHLRDMYRFFKAKTRANLKFIWEPRGGEWSSTLIRKVCGDLGLAEGVDPLVRQPFKAAFHYFRFHGRYEKGKVIYQHAYSDEEIDLILERCAGCPTYALFNNSAMWDDARRFQKKIMGGAE